MERRTFILDAAAGLLVACAMIVAGLTVRRELFAPDRQSGSVLVSDWADYATEGHVIGDNNAAVTIVEFSDFQCPYCASFASHMDSLRALGVTDVRVVYRHFPGLGHESAVPAIRASECAADVDKFESMHDALFEYSDSLGVAGWSWFAQRAGIADTVRFSECMQSTTEISSLVRDTIAARKLGVAGTPTLLIHDLRPRGLPPFDSLIAYISRARAQTQRAEAGR